VFPGSQPMATCAHSGNSEFRNGPLITSSFVAKIQPFAGLAAPNIEGVILAPAGEYRQSRSLSERIGAYPNGLSVLRGLNSQMSVRYNWLGIWRLAEPLPKIPSGSNS
jgi:hypothetical protein